MEKYPWHALDGHEIVRILETDAEKGLALSEAKARASVFGPNELEKELSGRFYKIIWQQIKSPLVFILIIAGFVSLILTNYSDAIIIFIALIINTAIGAYQEGRASQAFEKLRASVKSSTTLIRGGQQQEVNAALLVPGDIILLKSGDRVPADARLLEVKTLETNEAALTGEWAGVEKNPQVLEEKKQITERTNMVWMGTLIAEGWAKAVVVATGNSSELGKIAFLVAEEKEIATPFQRGVKRLAHWIGGTVGVFSILIFALGMARSQPFSEMFLITVALAVAAIPEGLPVAVTVVLAIGMHRILKKGGLVRKLTAVETLGSTSVILTDKTGTLTQAKMSVASIVTAQETLAGHAKKDLSPAILEVLRAGIFSSGAFIENPEDALEQWRVRGRPTEKALLLAGIESGIKPHELLDQEPRIDFLPFDAERRFSASLHKTNHKNRLYVAGAPETLLEMSRRVRIGKKNKPLTQKQKNKLADAYLEATRRGARVIGVGMREGTWKEIARTKDRVFDNVTFLGLISFHDPLRPDVKEVIQEAKAAGLRIVLVTGDHSATAEAVARASGLVEKNEYKMLEGSDIENKKPEELRKLVGEVSIFSRVLPHQKMDIVKAWQDNDEIVAMTGDGVNDAPALRSADIGIALGSGTDVAKESADLVLTKDSLSVIVRAIEEGRIILDNLRKIITYLLATSFSEIVLIAGALIFGLPLPILPGQILWANMAQGGFMNFALAFEPKEADVLTRDPKVHSSKKILTPEMLWIIFGVGLITSFFLFLVFLFLLYRGVPIQNIRTIMFVGVTLGTLFFAFSFKSLRRPLWKINPFSNRYLLFALGFSLTLLAAALYVDPLRRLLGIVTPTPSTLLILAGIGIFNLIVIELSKWYFIGRALNHKIEL